MDVRRFLCHDLAGPTAELDADQARHARKALRLGPGDAVVLIDGRGGQATGTLLEVTAGRAVVQVGDVERVDPPRPRITLAVAIPKGDRADAMVDQLSQLGVDRLVPLTTERSVVSPRPAKLDRFRRRAEEAMKQCGRLHVMTIGEMTPLQAAFAEPADVRLVLHPDGPAVTSLAPRLQQAATVLALIGPEGGFSDDELSAAAAADIERLALPTPVLRIETAAPAAAAVLRTLAGP